VVLDGALGDEEPGGDLSVCGSLGAAAFRAKEVSKPLNWL
jgi:hypothetical protein